MEAMFFYCNSLLALPDISLWNISNVASMNVCHCHLSQIYPDGIHLNLQTYLVYLAVVNY